MTRPVPRPFSRHYWDLVDDKRFEEVFPDDHHYATWSRLLMLADQAWPASAHLPASARKASVAKLVAVELVTLFPGGRFRVTGLDAGRTARAEQAQNAAGARWSSGRNAASNADSNAASTADVMPSQSSQSKREETSQPASHAPDPADVVWNLTGRYPTDKAIGWVDDLTSAYGPEAVIRALAIAHQQDRNGSTLFGRTQDLLRAEARALTLKEQATVKAELKERRSAPRQDIDPEALAEEVRRIMEGKAA